MLHVILFQSVSVFLIAHKSGKAAGAGVVVVTELFLMQIGKQAPGLLRDLGAEPGQRWPDPDIQARTGHF